jgi:uncharacterized protein (DUF362 family)
MEHLITRRKFLKASGRVLAAGGLTDRLVALDLSSSPDLVAVEGLNYYESTTRAVEALGGVRKFVSNGARVGLLVNSVFDKPGTFVKPQIALALVAMCYEAGAREIVSLEDVSPSYWRRATLSKEHAEMVRTVRGSRGGVAVDIKGGRRLTSVEVTRDLMDCDVYINVPVFKDHEGTKFTGSLKNLMGATAGSTNRSWHGGAIVGGYYDDVPYLSECIAEGNLVRTPTLCVGDATEVIVTNGPFGPGKVLSPHVVVAGTDPVAVDAFGAKLLGLDPRKILMLQSASELGMGSLETSAVRFIRPRG